jgi:hypothetical protein
LTWIKVMPCALGGRIFGGVGRIVAQPFSNRGPQSMRQRAMFAIALSLILGLPLVSRSEQPAGAPEEAPRQVQTPLPGSGSAPPSRAPAAPEEEEATPTRREGQASDGKSEPQKEDKSEQGGLAGFLMKLLRSVGPLPWFER